MQTVLRRCPLPNRNRVVAPYPRSNAPRKRFHRRATQAPASHRHQQRCVRTQTAPATDRGSWRQLRQGRARSTFEALKARAKPRVESRRRRQYSALMVSTGNESASRQTRAATSPISRACETPPQSHNPPKRSPQTAAPQGYARIPTSVRFPRLSLPRSEHRFARSAAQRSAHPPALPQYIPVRPKSRPQQPAESPSPAEHSTETPARQQPNVRLSEDRRPTSPTTPRQATPPPAAQPPRKAQDPQIARSDTKPPSTS